MIRRIAYLDDGRVFRLGRRPHDVTKGNWYFGFRCKGCGEPIYSIPDPLNKGHLFEIAGTGLFSTRCELCGLDTDYKGEDLTALLANKDIPSPHQSTHRIEPTNMPRQPLKIRYPNVKPTFGPGFLEDRPKAAAIVARCIALWSDVEVQLARLMAALLHANTEAAVATFLALKNSRAQKDLLEAAASAVLDEKDSNLFGAIMTLRTSLEKERNALVHGQFGGAAEIAEGIVWIEQMDHVRHTANVTLNGVTDDALDWLRARVFVYEPGDLETIARDFEEFYHGLGYFVGYVGSDNAAWRFERYPQLCALPLFKRELAK